MFVSTSWLIAAGIETTCLVFSRMVAYSWGKMAFEQPNSNPSTPPFSTHLIHNFRLYLLSKTPIGMRSNGYSKNCVGYVRATGRLLNFSPSAWRTGKLWQEVWWASKRWDLN